MNQELERHLRRVMLWQRGFLVAVLAISVLGAVIAARSGEGLAVGQFAAVAVISVGGLAWNVVHVHRRPDRTSPPALSP